MKSDINELKQDESPKAQSFLKVMLLSMVTSLCGGFIYVSAGAMDMRVFTLAGLALLIGGAAFFLAHSLKLLMNSSSSD
jgi:hypothetical protein